MNSQARLDTIEKLSAGSLLFFDGHIMMYLGTVNDQPYVISSVSSFCAKNEGQYEVTVPIEANSVTINSLTETFRASGYSWLDALSMYNSI